MPVAGKGKIRNLKGLLSPSRGREKGR